jgi:hypothetical protein
MKDKIVSMFEEALRRRNIKEAAKALAMTRIKNGLFQIGVGIPDQ